MCALTTAQAARSLGVSPSTVAREANQASLAGLQVAHLPADQEYVDHARELRGCAKWLEQRVQWLRTNDSR